MNKESNEKLVELIQAGNQEYLIELWNNIERFVSLKAWDREQGDGRGYRDDMLQEAYISLIEATNNYKPTNKKFLGYFADYYLPGAFQRAIYGGTLQQSIKDPIVNSISLDQPLSNEEGQGEEQLYNLVEDSEAELPYRQIENVEQQGHVRDILLKAINSIENTTERNIVTFHYNNNTTLKRGYELGGYSFNYSFYATQYRNGLRKVMNYIIFRVRQAERQEAGIQHYIDRAYGTHRYYKGSLQAFKNNNFTSNTEALALEHLSRLERNTRVKGYYNQAYNNAERLTLK